MRFRFSAGLLLMTALYPLIAFAQSVLFRPDVEAGDLLEEIADFRIGDDVQTRTRLALVARLLSWSLPW